MRVSKRSRERERERERQSKRERDAKGENQVKRIKKLKKATLDRISAKQEKIQLLSILVCFSLRYVFASQRKKKDSDQKTSE